MLVQFLSIVLFLGLVLILGGAWSAYWGRSNSETDETLTVLRDMRTGGHWGMVGGSFLAATGAGGLIIVWMIDVIS